MEIMSNVYRVQSLETANQLARDLVEKGDLEFSNDFAYVRDNTRLQGLRYREDMTWMIHWDVNDTLLLAKGFYK